MRGGMARVALLVVAGAALAGCGLLVGERAGGGVASSSCAVINGGACIEQTERIAARHPGATNVDLTCTAPVCDRRGGSGTAVVTLANGTTVNDVFAYVGDPGPIPIPTCIGLAPVVCLSVAESRVNDLPPSKRVVAIEVRCTLASCVADGGDTQVSVTMADGTKDEGGFGWEGELP
ncbi:MAG TPA: hypothetical protein VES19_13380 [Candidatus Limnocylindrales bacterium]|nr:hypothetical protein [Candidatus Limnocylindrales bacterium]